MPNDVIKRLNVLDPTAPGGYRMTDIGAEGEHIEVKYEGAPSDLQSAIDGIEASIAGIGSPRWNGTGKEQIKDQNVVYTEQHKFGICYGDASVDGTICTVTNINDFLLQNHGTVVIYFEGDVAADATLNINGTGAKPIYYQNAPIIRRIINAGDTATFIYDASRGQYILTSVDSGTGATKIVPDTADFDYDNETGSLKLDIPIYTGTSEEWANLPSAEKDHYTGGIVNLTDQSEFTIPSLVDEVQAGNANAVTSNAVALKNNEFASELAGNIETSNIAIYPHNAGEYIHYTNEVGVTKFASVKQNIVVGDTISDKVINTDVGSEINNCLKYDEEFWNTKTWVNGKNIIGRYIWTDGENIYFSQSTSQYVLDKSTSTWNSKTWNGFTPLTGDRIWTDGESIYYSYESDQYVLDKATSTWNPKTWSGYTSLYKGGIWTDGENIYYSYESNQYVLDKATSTWNVKIWNGFIPESGAIWTDGENIYYSRGNSSNQYVLDKATSTWNAKTWIGLTYLYSGAIWTDGENIYCSSLPDQYVLDKATSTWNAKTWNINLDNRQDIWTDGKNIYYSNVVMQYVLTKTNSDIQNQIYSLNSAKVRYGYFSGTTDANGELLSYFSTSNIFILSAWLEVDDNTGKYVLLGVKNGFFSFMVCNNSFTKVANQNVSIRYSYITL